MFTVRMMGLLLILSFIFEVALITVTLLLVNEVRDDKVDDMKLTFVQVGNWIHVGAVGLLFVGSLVLTPFVMKYVDLSDFHGSRSDEIKPHGLMPASKRIGRKKRSEEYGAWSPRSSSSSSSSSEDDGNEDE